MKRQLLNTFPRVSCGLVVGTFLILFSSVQAQEITIATLEFSEHAYDLDANAVVARLPGELPLADGADIQLAYNAERIPHAVVVGVSEGVELAFLDEMIFDAIGPDDVAGMTFSAEAFDAPWEPYDTVVVRTESGAVFKIGNAVESEFSVTFNCSQLQ